MFIKVYTSVMMLLTQWIHIMESFWKAAKQTGISKSNEFRCFTRNVTSTCMGQEQMYKIKLENGDHFTCNESHILSLKYKEKYKQPAIVDISVKEYLKLDINVRSKLVCLFD